MSDDSYVGGGPQRYAPRFEMEPMSHGHFVPHSDWKAEHDAREKAENRARTACSLLCEWVSLETDAHLCRDRSQILEETKSLLLGGSAESSSDGSS